MLGKIIPLIATIRPLWGYVLNYVMCLAFVATVPCILRKVVRD